MSKGETGSLFSLFISFLEVLAFKATTISEEREKSSRLLTSKARRAWPQTLVRPSHTLIGKGMTLIAAEPETGLGRANGQSNRSLLLEIGWRFIIKICVLMHYPVNKGVKSKHLVYGWPTWF